MKERARMLIKNSYVIDGCVFAEGNYKGCTKQVKESGLNAFFLTTPNSHGGFTQTVNSIGNLYDFVDKSDYLFFVREYKDIIKIKEMNKMGIVLSFQDPSSIENSFAQLRVFYELGMRVIQLTYNKANYIGTGCAESNDNGLTDFGKQIIKEMNRLGILVDLSHCSRLTGIQAMETSEKPVIFSHTGVKRFTDSPRNKTDEEIKLLVERRGVIGISPWGPLCWDKDEGKQPTLENYINHLDYVVEKYGIDYVGYGGDTTIDGSLDVVGTTEQSNLYPSVVKEYDEKVGIAPELRHAKNFKGSAEIINVVEALLKKGYKDEDISKFLGGNFMRVLKETWK